MVLLKLEMFIHIDRGYENIDHKLISLGAVITRRQSRRLVINLKKMYLKSRYFNVIILKQLTL